MGCRCLLATLALVVALGSIPFAGGGAQTTQGTSSAKQLAAPGKLWAAQVSPGEFTLSWGAVPGAIAYRVFVRNDKGEAVRLGEVGASGTRFVASISGVARLAGSVLERFRFVVQAIGAGGVLGAPGLFNEVTPAKAGAGKGAAARTNVQVAESAPGVVTLTWDEVEGATAYAIGRASGTSGFQRLCDVCPVGGRYVDTVRTAGVRYVYRITGLTPSGATRGTISDSVVTGSVSFAGTGGGTGGSTGGGTTPATATDPDLKGLAEGVTVTARPIRLRPPVVRAVVRIATPLVQNITAQLMRQACNGPLRVVARIANNAPFEIDDALGGLDFPECNGSGKLSVSYVVQLSDPKGLVAQSKAASVEVPLEEVATAPPATPTNLRIARMSNGSRILTWDLVAGASRYRIERVVGAKGAWTLLREVEGSVKSHTDATVVSETPRYRITAVNAAGASAAAIFP